MWKLPTLHHVHLRGRVAMGERAAMVFCHRVSLARLMRQIFPPRGYTQHLFCHADGDTASEVRPIHAGVKRWTGRWCTSACDGMAAELERLASDVRLELSSAMKAFRAGVRRHGVA